jgi:diguanylate cyclase (GGDEF)-like protein/PAS domain S-box-containing protein
MLACACKLLGTMDHETETSDQTHAPTGWRPRVAGLLCAFGVNTLRGRFLYMASLLLVLLVLMAWTVNSRVREVSSDNATNLTDRHRVYALTRGMSNALWEAEQDLQQFMLQPTASKRERFAVTLAYLIDDSEQLEQTTWARRTDGMRERLEDLLRDLRQLRAEGLRLMEVRASPTQTFPAMPIMLNTMQPRSEEFIDVTALAIEEAKAHVTHPGQLEAMQLFYDTLYAWSRMTDAFRLYVSNRFGIFDTSPETSMRHQAGVVESFSARIVANLARLTEIDKQGQLLFEQSSALENMQNLHRHWHQAWREVSAVWTSASWRLDTQALQNSVEPLFASVWSNVREIEKQVDANSVEDLSLLAQVATRLSDSLWWVVLLGLAASIFMFAIFETQIRRPIARVVAALKAEAAGEENITVPQTRLVETRDLTQAFDHMRREVHSRQARLEAVLHYAGEAILTIDEHGRIESFNPAAERLFGRSVAEVVGQNVSLLMPEPYRSEHDGYLQRYLGDDEQRVIGQAREVEALHKDGRVFPVEINVSEMWVDGRRLFTGMLADISERKAMLEQLELTLDQLNTREQRLHTILNNTAEGIITFDEHGVVEGFNQSAEKLFGWVEDEVIGTSIAQLISPEAREIRDDYLEHFMRAEIQRLIGHEGELLGRHKDGSNFPMAVKISGMWLENQQKYIAMVSNISERKALMENLRKLAEHDGLTGLYNRTYFHGELERVVERVHRSELVNCALLYIDLDHFKYVNDTLGHAAGDTLLIEVANILTRRARKSDLVTRLGGDEFTVLLYDTQPEQLEKIADSFRRQLADFNFSYEGQTVAIGCSIGVAIIEPSAQSSAEVMSRADLACHIAKRSGRNQVHRFAPEDAKDVTTMSLDMGWSRRIREAVEHNRFALACQPIVSTGTREIKTYEVLIRMLDENGGLIMPGGFLPTAERFGLSLDIDRWVITNAIETLAEQRATLPELCYTINLSAQTLNTPVICDLIQDKLRATGLDPAALIFEVTETAAIADLNAAAALLARLRVLGCRTALDDFGSGMSSFAYLKELPVDIVKIDGRFVKHIATSAVDKAMVRAMNDIAHALGKETIAEFVEDEAAFQILIELGVDYGQGYHLGRPDVIAPCNAIAAHAGVPGFCRL